jgi:Na+-driven multidrug efflux pump
MVIFDAFTLPIILLAFPLNQPKILAASDAFRFIVLVLVALQLIPIIGPAGAANAKIGAKVAGFLLLLLYIWRKNPLPSQSDAQNKD